MFIRQHTHEEVRWWSRVAWCKNLHCDLLYPSTQCVQNGEMQLGQQSNWSGMRVERRRDSGSNLLTPKSPWAKLYVVEFQTYRGGWPLLRQLNSKTPSSLKRYTWSKLNWYMVSSPACTRRISITMSHKDFPAKVIRKFGFWMINLGCTHQCQGGRWGWTRLAWNV